LADKVVDHSSLMARVALWLFSVTGVARQQKHAYCDPEK